MTIPRAPDDDRNALIQLHRILSMADVGTWQWDLASDQLVWDRGHYLLCGVDESVSPISAQFFLGAIVHEDDRDAVQAEVERARRDRSEYFAEYRIRRIDDGSVRWMQGRGFFSYADDEAVSAAGILLDINSRRVAEIHERRIRERLAILQRVSERISAARTPAEIADAVVAEAFSRDGMMMANAYRLTNDGHSFELLATRGLSGVSLADWVLFDNAPGLPGFDAITRGPVFAESGKELQRRFPVLQSSTMVGELGATAIMPLLEVTNDGVVPIGLLSLSYSDARHLQEHDLEFLSSLARVSGTGLARALAHEREAFARVELEVRTRELLEQAAARAADAERFRLLFDSNPSPMWVFDAESLAFLAVNRAATAEYGWSREEFLQMTILDIRPEEDVEPLRAAAKTGFPEMQTRRASRHLTRNGAIRNVDLTSHPIPWQGRPARLVLAQDETQRIVLEEQLRQSQKMEAIGQLAGGVAHDFNNLLTVILGNLEFARSSVPENFTTVHDDLEEVAKAATRARVLVGQLLAFGRKQRVRPRDLDLNDVVRDAESMLRRLIGEEIVLETKLSTPSLLVHADRGQVEQVLLNLAVNARDAMLTPIYGRSGIGGTLTLTTDSVVHDDVHREFPSLPPGRYVRLRVQDTGHGMTKETRERLFEPFYTTKPVGSGTGLGLATVFSIMTQCGGVVRVDSEYGHGATFTLLFAEISVPDMHVTDETPIPVAVTTRGTILLVEDEAAVRAASRRMLEARGYAVLEASNGVEALALWHHNAADLRAVVTDVRMPEMGGYELATKLRATREELPIIFVSGYSSDLHAGSGPSDAFVEKPFTSDILSAAVQRAIALRERE